ncbi:MAG TPA: hydroxymethylbilane synthase [Nitrospiria bacterium]|nr:hydroxymethylbilane synthase [Candidatus Manganitrophaceae bacterium]HIL33955.1 hydroxymethylbilane synthase [Candidatus Manganitrophaceae bacterium]
MPKPLIKIGSRGSQLALWQAQWVQSQLQSKGLRVEIQKIKTTGDKILDVPLAKLGGKGLFVKEIEEALMRKEIDLAVHSMKDVPSEIPEPLHLAAIPRREDPRDAVISREGLNIAGLPRGATIGTSSLRRQTQLSAFRSDLKFVMLRGNLGTRLRKLEEGNFDAIILAAAGLHRLGWKDRITEYLSPEILLPAIGQGALGIECRRDDQETNTLIAFLNDSETVYTVSAERAMLIRLEGGCQIPIGGYATLNEGRVTLRGLVASLDGKEIIRESQTADASEATPLGISVAESLLAKGADRILWEIYEDD